MGSGQCTQLTASGRGNGGAGCDRHAVDRAIVKLHYACNNRCLFCHSADHKKFGSSPENLLQKIDRSLDLGIGQVLLSGGEPTIYPGLETILRHLEKRSLPCGFISNGRMFSYPSFTRRVLAAGGSYFYLSLHSHLPSVHDFLCGSTGAWAQTLAGIRNLAGASGNPLVKINCVVTTLNLPHLKETLRFLADQGVGAVKFSYPEFKGMAAGTGAPLIPGMRTAARGIAEAMQTALVTDVSCGWDGLPYCLIPEQSRPVLDNLETNRIWYMSEAFEEYFHRTDQGRRTKEECCILCSYNEICTGRYAGYGNPGLRPVVRTVPNYFVMKEIARFPHPGGECPLEAQPSLGHLPFQRVAVRKGAFTVLYEAANPFFKADVIRAAKAKQQLYDLPADSRNADFSLADARKLAPTPGCENCARPCAGLYAPGPDGFLDGNGPMEACLETLTGNVLEIGFGRLTHADTFFGRLQNAVAYTGIEPDHASYAAAVSAYPEADLIRAGVEDFQGQPGFYDAILMLGSFNHIRDIPAALRRIRGWLKDNGVLVVAENAIFGVVGGDAYATLSAWPLGRGYLHYRNATPETAEAILRRSGFLVQDRLEVGQDNGNFWLLRARKISRGSHRPDST